MNRELKYNGYRGSAEIDDGIWRGKILNIDDLVMYQSDNFESLEEEFRIAVDDWLETRRNL